MTIALFVEGRSDKDTIPLLAKKILATRSKPPALEVRTIRRGNMFKARKVAEHVRVLSRKHQNLSKILICVDSHCTSENQMAGRVREVERELESMKVPVPPRFCLVVHALEGWLMAAPQALSSYLQVSGGLSITQAMAFDCKPKEVLSEVFARVGRTFDYMRDDPAIAELADPDEMSKLSPSFAAFKQHLLDP